MGEPRGATSPVWYQGGVPIKPLRQAARRGLETGGDSDPRLLVRALALAGTLEQGRHASSQRGSSTEFYDFRPYEAGDPLASVDWRLYGRTDRHFVRRFQHDARLTITVALDASASMEFAGLPGSRSGVTKLERAIELGAATLALGARQGDRVGLVVTDSGKGVLRRVAPSPGRGGLVRTVAALGVTTPGEPGAMAGDENSAPGSLARALFAILDGPDAPARRGVAVLIGDAFEPVEPLGRALASARARGLTPVLMRTLTPDEAEVPRAGARVYVDPETGGRVRAGDAARVREAMEAHASSVARLCAHTGTRLVVARTDGDPTIALRSAFAR